MNTSITSGQTSSGLIVQSGGVATVFFGGIVSETTVLSGGEVYLSGGAEHHTVVFQGGDDLVYEGQSYDTVLSGGTQTVGIYGRASGTVILAGGVQSLSYSAGATGTVISSGGLQTVDEANVSSTTISTGGVQVLEGYAAQDESFLGFSYAAQLAGGTELIQSGGEAFATTIGGGGVEVVFAGGVASATQIHSGGLLIVMGGGSAGGTTVAAGGTVGSTGVVLLSGSAFASFGPVFSGTSVGSGAAEYVLNDGLASSGVVAAGGVQVVYSGGTVSGTLIAGVESLSSGGATTAVSVGAGGVQYVLSGAIAAATSIGLGGEQSIFASGIASNTLVQGGIQLVNGGVASGTVLQGGQQIVSQGTASGTIIRAGGVLSERLDYAGTVTGAIISSGGAAVIKTQASFTQVLSGGTLVVLPGATAAGTFTAPGAQVVSTGAVLLTPNGVVSAAAVLTDAVVSAEAQEYVLSGGAVQGGTVLSGGVVSAYAGTIASQTILAGGSQYIAGGATDHVIISGGTQEVDSGAAANFTTIASGGTQFVASGASASASFIASGGLQDDRGTVTDTTISGGSQTILVVGHGSGTFVSTGAGTTIEAGGSQTVYFQALVSGAVVRDGTQFLLSGAETSATVLSAGGVQIVAQGTAIDTQVQSGGVLHVDESYAPYSASYPYSNAPYDGPVLARGAVVFSGGEIEVGIGAVADTVINSGGVVINLSGLAQGTDIKSGGTLVLFHGTASSTTIEAGGTLVSGGVFLFASGGKLLDWAETLSGAVVSAGQAEYVDSGTALGTEVLAGGFQFVSAGLAGGTVVASLGRVYVSGGVLSGALVESGGAVELSAPARTSGTADATTIASGAVLTVAAGAANGSIVHGGGLQVIGVSSSEYGLQGTASGTVLSGTAAASAVEIVSGTTTTGTSITYGLESVLSGGAASNTTVSVGGVLQLAAGSVIGATILSGGRFVEQTGSATSITVSAGGIATFSAFSFSASVLGGTLDVENTAAIIANTTVASSGRVVLHAGSALGTTIGNLGTQLVDGAGAVAFLSDIQSGGLEIARFGDGFGTGAVQEATVASGGTLATAGTLAGGGYNFSAAISSFLQQGGTLDLRDDLYTSAATASFDATTNQLTIAGATHDGVLQLAGDYADETFLLSDDGAGGTAVTLEGTPCYCRGTHIRTPSGDVPVEDLRIGDLLLTHSGAARALRWIGRRAYAGRFAAGNKDVLPICFRAGSLDGELPRRELRVSPLHAIYLDNVLIPAHALVNGDSIFQQAQVESVEYFHLELETHDIILAEGAPSETYLDDGNRAMFHNAASHAALYPAAAAVARLYCAPRITKGPVVEVVRRRLAAFTQRGPLQGWLDLATHTRIAGWAADKAGPVRLRIAADGVLLGEIIAGLHRQDVAAQGGVAACGFEFTIPTALLSTRTHEIAVSRVDDGVPLPNSPWIIDATATDLQGHIDLADRTRVVGWVHAPGAPVRLRVLVDGTPAGEILADGWRADIAAAAVADGRAAFDFVFPTPLAPERPHLIELRRCDDGAPCPGSPAVVMAEPRFDTALERLVTDAVGHVADTDRLRLASFLQAQAQRLAMPPPRRRANRPR